MGFSPQRLQTPRTSGEDLISQLLTGPPTTRRTGLFDTETSFDNPSAALMQIISGNLPQFQGPFGVPLTGLQQNVLGATGERSTSLLDALAGIATGSSGDPTAEARGFLSTLSGPAALGDVFSSIDTARRFGLGRDIRDIREQFSASGLRDTTDLARAIGTRQAESEAEQGSLFGRLGLENLGQRTQAAGILGQLGLGGEAQRLGALQAFPGLARGLFDVGEAGRTVEEAPLLRQLQEFQRTQGALLPLLLQFFGGAPQITSPGLGSQLLGAGATVAGGALGG